MNDAQTSGTSSMICCKKANTGHQNDEEKVDVGVGRGRHSKGAPAPDRFVRYSQSWIFKALYFIFYI